MIMIIHDKVYNMNNDDSYVDYMNQNVKIVSNILYIEMAKILMKKKNDFNEIHSTIIMKKK